MEKPETKMEFRLLETRGVPEGSLLCVRLGDHKRQVQLGHNHCCRFPEVTGRQHMKIEIFTRTAHTRLLVDGDTRECSVPLEPMPDKLDCSEEAVPFVQFELVAANQSREMTRLPRSATSEAASSRPASATSASSRVKDARGAQDYMARHGVEEMMHTLLRSILKEQPEQPFEYMIKVLDNSLRARSGDVAPPPSTPQKRPQSAPLGRGTPSRGSRTPLLTPSFSASGKVRPQSASSLGRGHPSSFSGVGHSASCSSLPMAPLSMADFRPQAPVTRAAPRRMTAPSQTLRAVAEGGPASPIYAIDAGTAPLSETPCAKAEFRGELVSVSGPDAAEIAACEPAQTYAQCWEATPHGQQELEPVANPGKGTGTQRQVETRQNLSEAMQDGSLQQFLREDPAAVQHLQQAIMKSLDGDKLLEIMSGMLSGKPS